jgi:hypothetical protein
LLEPSFGIREDFVLELAVEIEQADVELQLGDVDAERGYDHETDSLSIISCGTGQTCLYKLCSTCERLQILCDLLSCKDGHRELI